ncbi:hypothetical protein QL285_026209 [Trifolium repens]|nr:hypothetical protein QL285_026204 [Trifolium repens]KAK2427642.1 hypothetical protein QL285_026209 [Trifolium repens]
MLAIDDVVDVNILLTHFCSFSPSVESGSRVGSDIKWLLCGCFVVPAVAFSFSFCSSRFCFSGWGVEAAML